jgi:hypothetical protein
MRVDAVRVHEKYTRLLEIGCFHIVLSSVLSELVDLIIVVISLLYLCIHLSFRVLLKRLNKNREHRNQHHMLAMLTRMKNHIQTFHRPKQATICLYANRPASFTSLRHSRYVLYHNSYPEKASLQLLVGFSSANACDIG